MPDLGVTIAGVLLSASLLLFLLFFSRFIQRLRPVAVAAHVAKAGRTAFAETLRYADRPDIRWEHGSSGAEPSRMVRSPRAGAIQAIDPDGLVRWAEEHRCELVLTHAIGDYVPTGGALIEILGSSDGPGSADDELLGMIALGDERTIQQDPAFAIRVMVDIAIRALSPRSTTPPRPCRC